jgi:hypothetical protein
MPAVPARPILIGKPRLLIGEGDDEVHFFEALVARLHLDDIQVEKYGGTAGLSRFLRDLARRPGYERLVALGVTRDADDDCSTTFDRVRGSLSSNGFPFPAVPGHITQGLLRIGVFILPDNQRAGMLEDLCLDSVAGDPAFACLDEFFQCVLNAAQRQPGHTPKARVHAWLATQPEPDKRLGEAARSGYWPWDNPAFDQLKHFLHSL